ncbi:MAG: NADP-dependent malic enzyme [Candidatus Ratteibacteria bacterium]|jgi:malate dehydrogenase (oxaloacetate-decarboxylating)
MASSLSDKEILRFHKGGKLHISPNIPLSNQRDLAIAYTPGVGRVCMDIHTSPEHAWDYTIKKNAVAVVTDGTAVLGLGDIGPLAALPVMEGKAILFKQFGNVDAYPICLNTKNVDAIVETVSSISSGFGGINLEDISSPRCFEIEERLKRKLKIPVFHDDQHGTAIVVLAALYNALKLTRRNIRDVRIVVNGAGASGIAVTRFLLRAGARNILMCDRTGILYRGRRKGMNAAKQKIVRKLSADSRGGSLYDGLKEAEVFIGLSGPKILTVEMIKCMRKDPIIFAMANPDPEVMPDIAIKAGAAIVGTGRSDFPNQINNLLAFPGIFRGALDVRAEKITEEMKIEASKAIAAMVPESKLSVRNIIPPALDKNIADVVAEAVRKSWKKRKKS